MLKKQKIFDAPYTVSALFFQVYRIKVFKKKFHNWSHSKNIQAQPNFQISNKHTSEFRFIEYKIKKNVKKYSTKNQIFVKLKLVNFIQMKFLSLICNKCKLKICGLGERIFTFAVLITRN